MGIKFLTKLKIFDSLTDEELNVVYELLEERLYQENNIIFSEGMPRIGMFIIKSGVVEIYRNIDNNDLRVTVVGEGRFMGEDSVIDNSAHHASAKALEDTTIYFLSLESIKIISDNYPVINSKLLLFIARTLSRRLYQSNDLTTVLDPSFFSGESRIEHDLLGERSVPEDVLYGIQTLRAMENFSITKIPIKLYPKMIKALAYLKKASAMANYDLKLLEKNKKKAIVQACDEIILGQHLDHFVVDMIQGGAGTSTNMNINEVVANRGLELMGHKRGEYEFLHPNADVNMAQSTNDVYPSSIKLGLILSYKKFKKAMVDLSMLFLKRAEDFQDVIKMGRTQLQDAVPMTLGQEFKVWGNMIEESVQDLDYIIKNKLNKLNMGATAIGTGITADPRYSSLFIHHLREFTGITELKIASNLVQATQDTSDFVSYSSGMKNLAIKLSKISNDLRLLSSGPRAGFNEINLPAVQPGSSIMPGKVNPVIPEVVNQVAFQVIGNDLTVNLASEAGQLELNAFEPVMAFDLFQSQDILINAMNTLASRAVAGITVNREICKKYVHESISLVTALNPYIGYENSTKAAKIAMKTGKAVYDIILEEKMMSKDQLDELMKPDNLIRPIKKLF
jgi:aspartate ammonia-lyase